LQGVARKFLARRWPALWKSPATLDHLDTAILSPIYSLAQNSTDLTEAEFKQAGRCFPRGFSASDFDAGKPSPMRQSAIPNREVEMMRRP
jgi:hypothetical protein